MDMISERTAFFMVVGVILVAALVVAPVAARTITTSGTNIYVGEENLNFGAAGSAFTGAVKIVDYSGTESDVIDKSFTLVNGNLAEVTVGIPTGSYYGVDAAGN